jgi:phospholipid/cholesterol/gamma-HCH transport system substrate-binding protein
MNDQKLKTRLGAVILLAGLITVSLGVMFEAFPSIQSSGYEILIHFPSAPGVRESTTVRKSGVDIGRVTEVELQSDGAVILTISVDNEVPILTRETCRIKMGSLLTGAAILEFTPLPDAQLLAEFDKDQNGLLDDDELALSRKPLTSGSLISNGLVVDDPLTVLVNMQQNMSETFGSIQGAGSGVQGASVEFQTLMESLNSSFEQSEAELQQAVRQTNTAMQKFEVAMDSLNTIVGDEQTRVKLKESVNEIPVVLRQAALTLASAQQTMKYFETVGRKAETNLDNLEKFTRPLGERGEMLVESITSSVENFDSTVSQMNELVTTLNNAEGSLHKIVHDDELYYSIKRTTTNIEEATKRMRPILNDLRVFSDKIATDPRQLGVSGMLDRRPAGVGVKSPLW